MKWKFWKKDYEILSYDITNKILYIDLSERPTQLKLLECMEREGINSIRLTINHLPYDFVKQGLYEQNKSSNMVTADTEKKTEVQKTIKKKARKRIKPSEL